tara:strand:- start:5906 stop:7513 length:1608 start_codon:yes stop_codon:yes gene_type:complete
MPHRIIKRVRQSPRATLRLRLTLWIAAIFTVMQWGVATVYWLYLHSVLDDINNATMGRLGTSAAAQIAPDLPDFEGGMADPSTSPTSLTFRFESVFIDVFDPSGRRVHGDIPPVVDAPGLPIADALRSGGPVMVKHPRWAPGFTGLPESPSRLRTVLVPVEGGDGLPYVVLVAISDGFARPQEAMVNTMLFTSVAVKPFLSVLVAWFIAGVAVAPLLRLRELARQLSPDRLGQSIQFEAGSAEISDLAGQLEEARARLHRAFSAQERFLSNVSHEIKTPIAVMGIEAQTLDLTGASDDIVYFVESVREESKRLGNLVESFLTLSRIQDGKTPAHARSYAANDLVMDSVEHCAVMAQQNSVYLMPSLFDDEALMDAAVAGDPELLTTMLDNLIRNAIRFSPRHGVVRVGLACDATTLFVRVGDEGPGIPPEKLPTVFDRFAQAGNEKRAGRGHGLGLSIAMGIAELHGGTIRVRNLEKSGCEFIIELPRCDTPQADTPCPDNQSDDHPEGDRPKDMDPPATDGPERGPGGVRLDGG